MAYFWFFTTVTFVILFVASSVLYVREADNTKEVAAQVRKKLNDLHKEKIKEIEDHYVNKLSSAESKRNQAISDRIFYKQELLKQAEQLAFHKKWGIIRRIVISELSVTYQIPKDAVSAIEIRLDRGYGDYLKDLKGIQNEEKKK